jgi:hypothetical protein
MSKYYANYSKITGVQQLKIVTNINGYNLETLEAVLYAAFGYRSFDQLEDE